MGASVLGALVDWHDWVHRKVESIDLLPGDGGRRKVSFDCTPPLIDTHGFKVEGYTSSNDALVPLTLMAKQTLDTVDLRDDAGRSVPFVGTHTNVMLACSALAFIAWLQLGKNDAKLLKIWPRIYSVVADDAGIASRVAVELIQELKLNEIMEQLFLELASSFPVFARVDPERIGTRQVIKLSYRWQEVERKWSIRSLARSFISTLAVGHGFSTAKYRIGAGAMYSAQTYHLEIAAPAGLVARQMELPKDRFESAVLVRGTSSVIHARAQYNRFGSFTEIAEVRFELDPTGLIPRIWWATLGIVSLYFWMLLVPDSIETLLRVADAATALLLFIPAFLVALNARPPENVLAGRILLPLRIEAIALALALFVSGASLVLGLPPEFIKALWGGILGFSSVLLATLTAGIVRVYADRILERGGGDK